MEETGKLSKMTIEMGQKKYELDGGGSGGLTPGALTETAGGALPESGCRADGNGKRKE